MLGFFCFAPLRPQKMIEKLDEDQWPSKQSPIHGIISILLSSAARITTIQLNVFVQWKWQTVWMAVFVFAAACFCILFYFSLVWGTVVSDSILFYSSAKNLPVKMLVPEPKMIYCFLLLCVECSLMQMNGSSSKVLFGCRYEKFSSTWSLFGKFSNFFIWFCFVLVCWFCVIWGVYKIRLRST